MMLHFSTYEGWSEWADFSLGAVLTLKITVVRQIRGTWYYRETADKKPTTWGCLQAVSKPRPWWFSQTQGINAWVQESIKSEAQIGCTQICVFVEGYSKPIIFKIIPVHLSIKFGIWPSRMLYWFYSGNEVFLILFSLFEHCSYSNHFPGSTQVSILLCLNSCLVN